MKLFDEDKISDEIVGSILFNLKDCLDKMVSTKYSLTFTVEWSVLLEEHLWFSLGILRRQY
jgi:hypothetical protein